MGGPSQNDSFTDKRLDWSQTEVALDYNAPYQNVLAYQVMFSSEDPFYIKKDTNGAVPSVSRGSGLAPWQFALVIILPTLTVLGVIAGIFIWYKYKQRQEQIQQQEAIEKYRLERDSRDGILTTEED